MTPKNLEDFFSKINQTFPNINFTFEKEVLGEIAFTDVLVIKIRTGKIQTDILKKELKIGTILINASVTFLVHRPLSHSFTHQKSLEKRKWLYKK